MSASSRSLQEARDAYKSIKNPQYYNGWAETYNTDCKLMEYQGHVVSAKLLRKHFKLSPDKATVLDVACGTGLVAKELFSLGFRQFVGVDGSQAMLDKASPLGLYQDLHLALLGTQPLPVNPGKFDVVMMVGVLHKKYLPVEVVRELCQAAKPGGLVVMTKANYQTNDSYTEDLLRELGRMEEEGLWKQLEVQVVNKYMMDPSHTEGWVSGTSYIYQKTL